MSILSEREFERRAEDLEWILCDVDGVLTDGGLYYDKRGDTLRFNVKDGLGVRLAQRAGLRVGLLSGRNSPALQRRAAELGIEVVLAGRSDKGPAFDEFLEAQGTAPRRVAFIGDDLPDVIVLGRCGLSFCPADAADEVQRIVHRVLSRSGGQGAVREMVREILQARGDWQKVLSPFTFEG